MSKKHHQIDVNVEETKEMIDNNEVVVSVLSVGKKEIGKIKHINPTKFEVIIDGEKAQHTKNSEDAFELIIRQWNLNQ